MTTPREAVDIAFAWLAKYAKHGPDCAKWKIVPQHTRSGLSKDWGGRYPTEEEMRRTPCTCGLDGVFDALCHSTIGAAPVDGAADTPRNPWEPFAWPGLSHAQYDAIGAWLSDTQGDRYATRLVVQTPENVLVCSIQRDWWERLLSRSESVEVGRLPNAIAAGAAATENKMGVPREQFPLKPEGT